MKVAVPAPPGAVTGDLPLIGPATEGARRDVQERRGTPDPDPLTAGRAGWFQAKAFPDAQQAMAELSLEPAPDLGPEGAPGETGEPSLDPREIAQEPAVRGPMEPARTRDQAGVERKAVHAILPPRLGCLSTGGASPHAAHSGGSPPRLFHGRSGGVGGKAQDK